jgi:hypothetical protein
MPLIHSKKPSAFKENIRAEVHAGKPVKQAVAIAYSEKRRAEHKKHMDSGGKVDGCPMCMGGNTASNEKEPIKLDDGGSVPAPSPSPTPDDDQDILDSRQSVSNGFKGNVSSWDEGGQVNGYNQSSASAAPEIQAPQQKQKSGLLAEGGEVSDPDDEIQNMVGQEMMDSIHSKDYKKLMGGIEAMVLRCLNKKED